jgi:hypothetical protein
VSGRRGPARSYEESCALLDQIVGRCVRDVEFGSAVLSDPETALLEYDLNEDELDDFRALRARHRDEAAESWAAIRLAIRLKGKLRST